MPAKTSGQSSSSGVEVVKVSLLSSGATWVLAGYEDFVKVHCSQALSEGQEGQTCLSVPSMSSL